MRSRRGLWHLLYGVIDDGMPALPAVTEHDTRTWVDALDYYDASPRAIQLLHGALTSRLSTLAFRTPVHFGLFAAAMGRLLAAASDPALVPALFDGMDVNDVEQRWAVVNTLAYFERQSGGCAASWPLYGDQVCGVAQPDWKHMHVTLRRWCTRP